MGKRLARRDESDSGFTLIELLVVVIIIGVLASIAIPTFLNQRKKGYDTTAKNDLRNLAGFEEIYLADYNTYGTIAQIQTSEPTLATTSQVTLSVVRYNGLNGYCLSAMSTKTGVVWYWDSGSGGLLPRGTTACPVTTTGTPGDTVTAP